MDNTRIKTLELQSHYLENEKISHRQGDSIIFANHVPNYRYIRSL